MKLTLDELCELTGGVLSGGDLVAYNDGRHVSLGKMSQGEFTLSEEGQAYIEALEAPAAPEAEPGLPSPPADADPVSEGEHVELSVNDAAALQDLLSGT